MWWWRCMLLCVCCYGFPLTACIVVMHSWAGGVLIGFRMLLMFYFIYNVSQSYKFERDHPRADPLKMKFYWAFGVYGTAYHHYLSYKLIVHLKNCCETDLLVPCHMQARAGFWCCL